MKSLVLRIAIGAGVLLAIAGCLDSNGKAPLDNANEDENAREGLAPQDTQMMAKSAPETPSELGTEAGTDPEPGAADRPSHDTESTPPDTDTAREIDTGDPSMDLDAGDSSDSDSGAIDLSISTDPVTLLVVFDKSGSMDDHWNEESKWMAASDALKQAVTPFQDRLTVGAILFPMMTDCEVEEITGDHQIYFMPGPEFITAWDLAADHNGPSGMTPLAQAFTVADRAIQMAEQEGLLKKTFKVFLLTDGEPNCDVDLETITDWPEQWLSQGITTYVFGLPGSASAVEVLDRIAKAGGTGKHISSDPGDTPDDLRDDVMAAI